MDGQVMEGVRYSIVVPVYGSASWLDELAARTILVMDSTGAGYELILVNDASPDSTTWARIQALVEAHPCVRGFDMLNNVGQFRATICGLEHARGAYVITMDDDLQHPPEEIPRLVEALSTRPELDCVFGAPRAKRHSVFRNLGSTFFGWLNARLYGKPRGLRTSSFRIMTRQLAEAVAAHRTSKPILGPLILQSTKRLGNVEVEHHARMHGRSGYATGRLIRTTWDNLVSASTFPLKAVSALGLLCATGSFFLGMWYLHQYLAGHIRVAGFVTQVLLIVFFGGLTLFSVGLLGEYVGRVIHEVARPPRYIIRAQCGQATPLDRELTRQHSGS